MAHQQPIKDFASGKVALELCNHPEFMTSPGDEDTYNTKSGGYLGIHHPANVTLDLGEEVTTKQISIKFMSDKDPLNQTPIEGQEYAFRLLSSCDGKLWRILYDTTETDCPYRRGWIHATFVEDGCAMRYFRVHTLHNPVSSGFQIVRLRLFDSLNKEMPEGEWVKLTTAGDCEINDTTPLATKLQNLAERLYRSVPADHKDSSHPAKQQQFDAIYNHILEKAFELQAVDGRIDQIRNIITPHLAKSLDDRYNESKRSIQREWTITLVLIAIYIVIKLIKLL